MSLIPSVWSYIRPQLTGLSLDAAIAAIADAQHGILARWQLVALGFSAGAIRNRIANGQLRPLHRGVYAVGHTNLTPNGRRMAAVLACGDDAFLSHNSAARMRGVRYASLSTFDVTVPAGKRKRRPGIRVHETAALHPEDVTLIDGIPVATIPRTLLDLAPILSADKLLNTIEEADRQHLFDLDAIDKAIARTPTRKGVPKLQRVLNAYRPPPFTRSQLEREVHDALAQRALPYHATNQVIHGIEVDIWFPASRLAVQIDTRRYHDSPRAFEYDRRSDFDLQLQWCRVVRITGKRWREERELVLQQIETLSAMPPPTPPS
jgi:very-short-patch-repair endonuclease